MELSELIESIDIVEYISRFVELEEKGGEYWGLSPFKDENTPSFSVRRESGSWYDFSSGLAGNVFTFTKNYYRCNGWRAAEILKEYAGIDDIENIPRIKLDATSVCKMFLPQKKSEKECKAKPLGDDCMSRFEYRPDKLSVWADEGISHDVMKEFQVMYDSFDNRIIYPIRDMDGRIVNIGGRTLDPDWKEKKLRKYTYRYGWGTINTIYGAAENLDFIKKEKEIILFEGAKSVLHAATWGIRNCGAILTSHMSPNQLRILIKLGVRVVFALDKDVDVTKDHNIIKLKNYAVVEYIKDTDNLIEDKDSPVDKGEETFRKLYEGRRRIR